MPGLLGTIGGYLTAGTSDSSISTRTSDYTAVSPYIDADPVIGRGLGTFTPPQYRVLDNQYLMTLIETGILGLVAFTLMLLVPAFVARDAWATSTDPLGRDLARGLFAADLVVLVSVGAFDAFGFWGFSGIAFLAFGLSGAMLAPRSDRADSRRPTATPARRHADPHAAGRTTGTTGTGDSTTARRPIDDATGSQSPPSRVRSRSSS